MISPALFNIFIEPMLLELNREFNIEDIFAYADDIAVCIYSVNQLRNAINIIETWSNKVGIPINFKKSGVLNIAPRINSRKLIQGTSIGNYPIVEKYKYLGVWLDEKLNPNTHIESYKQKVNYLISRFKIIPKNSVSPKFMINLWTLIIRPIFDYAICFAKLKNQTSFKKYIAQELSSFKQLMGMRSTVSNEIIKDMMTYDPEQFCQEIIRRAEIRWDERKIHRISQEEYSTPIQYRRETSTLLLTWKMIWGQNALFNICKTHQTLVTPQHLKSLHDLQKVPDLSQILREGFELQKRLDSSKRKGRILRQIEIAINNYENIYIKIIDCNDSFHHF